MNILSISVCDSICISEEMAIEVLIVRIAIGDCPSFALKEGRSMLSIEKCRQLAPNMKNLSDEEVLEIETDLYAMAQLAFEDWIENQKGSKNI